MMERDVQSSKFLASVAVGVLLVSGQAFAGFEWEATSKTVRVENEPVTDVVAEVLEPVTQIKSTPAPAVAPEPKVEPVVPKDVVEGFGHDVPLSYALVSIVPSKYGTAFGKEVNPAQPITWRGGKPWDKVLEDALEPQGLSVHVDEQKVSIHPAPETPVVEEVTTQEEKVLKVIPEKMDASEEEVAPSAIREVYVRRGSGNIELKDDSPETTVEAEPVDIIQEVEGQEPVEEVAIEDTQEIVEETPEEEPKVVEKVVLDIPEEVASYTAPSSDENVFEIVMSEREPVPVLDTKKVMTFHAKSGQTVKGTLEKWSDEANVQLYWETPYDFPVEKSVALTATYPMAVQALVGRFDDIDPRPTVKLHPNWPHGPSILTVK